MYLFTLWRLLEAILFFAVLCLKSIEISLVGTINVTKTIDSNALDKETLIYFPF